MFDIAVIGAGPAGSTVARLLGAYCKIALIEKRDLERGKPCARNEKCCGGLLAPDAQKALAALSLGLPRSVIVDPQLFAVRSLDLATGHERYYQRHYINIDRLLFGRGCKAFVLPDFRNCPQSTGLHSSLHEERTARLPGGASGYRRRRGALAGSFPPCRERKGPPLFRHRGMVRMPRRPSVLFGALRSGRHRFLRLDHSQKRRAHRGCGP